MSKNSSIIIPKIHRDLSSFEPDTSKILVLDTETIRLYSGIKLVSIYHNGKVFVLDTKKVALIDIYEAIKDCPIIMHNASYDIACFMNDLDLKTTAFERFEDTLILAKLGLYRFIDSFSLDECAKYVIGSDIYEAYDKKELQKSFVATKRKDTMNLEPSKEQVEYAALDVLATKAVWQRLSYLRDEEVYKLDKEFIKNCAVWQRRGIPIVQSKLELLRSEVSKELDSLKLDFNPCSPKQVKQLLGRADSSKNTLKSLMFEDNEVAIKTYTARSLLKKLNFCERYSHDRVKGYFSPTTASGRVRCSGAKDTLNPGTDNTDNIMQIPRSMHSVVGYEPNDSRFLVYADYAQLELRTICAETGDPVLLDLFERGVDLHKYAATKLYNIPSLDEVGKDERTMAKFANFCLLYLGSWKALKGVLTELGTQAPPSDEECQRLTNEWRTIYPGLQAWHKKLLAKVGRNDYINQTLNGRPFKAKLFTDLAAVQNQGLGAEVSKYTLKYLHDYFEGLDIIHFIHDSFFLEAKNLQDAEDKAKKLAFCMLKGWFKGVERGKAPKLSMPLEVEVIKRWDLSETEEVAYSFKAATLEDLERLENEFRRN